MKYIFHTESTMVLVSAIVIPLFFECMVNSGILGAVKQAFSSRNKK
jgi:hypothetical protein